MRLVRRLAVLIAAVCSAAVAASPAAATFGAPFDLSAAGQDASSAQVAVDPDGNAVFVWSRFDGAHWRVQARARSAAGVLSAVQTLSSSGQDALIPEVAVDAAGDAVFVWSRFDGAGWRVQARTRTAAGSLSPVQNLSAGQALGITKVAVEPGGDAVFAWEDFEGAEFQIEARARTAAGVLSPVQPLSDPGQNAITPELGIDADGDAVVAWQRSDGSNNRIQARARSAAGVLSPVQNLSQAGHDSVTPELAVESDGDAVFAWERSDGAMRRVQARTRSAAGVLSPIQALSDTAQPAASPAVAVDPDGDAVFAWHRFDGSNYRIQVRARNPAGVLSAVQTLSSRREDALFPDVAVDAGGDAVVVWRVDHPGGPKVVDARERSAAGALSALQILSDDEQDASDPQVAMSANGDAVSTWWRFDGAKKRIQAAIGP